MQNSKKGCTPFQKGITLSKDQCPKTPKEEAHMRDRKNRHITLSQASYIDKILVQFAMHNFKKR